MDIFVNGQARQFDSPLSVAALLGQLNIGGRTAVERNGEIVPRSQHASVLLWPGDRVEIVTAIGGG